MGVQAGGVFRTFLVMAAADLNIGGNGVPSTDYAPHNVDSRQNASTRSPANLLSYRFPLISFTLHDLRCPLFCCFQLQAYGAQNHRSLRCRDSRHANALLTAALIKRGDGACHGQSQTHFLFPSTSRTRRENRFLVLRS